MYAMLLDYFNIFINIRLFGKFGKFKIKRFS